MKKITTILVLLMLTVYMAACAPSTSTTSTPSGTGTTMTTETPSSLETTATGPAAASVGNVDDLVALVNKYVASGDITGQAENGLLAKLKTINEKLMNGQVDPAANEMGAFVNEVQAQAGKKVSATAATALIAKAQEMAATFGVTVPVTGGKSTEAAATTMPSDTMPSDTMPANLSKPTPMGTPVDHQTQWDAIATQVTQKVGFSAFNYDLYQLPAKASWDATVAYYTTKAAAAGWGAAPTSMNEMSDGHYAVWSVKGSDGKTNYFIVAQAEDKDNTITLNIFGTK